MSFIWPSMLFLLLSVPLAIGLYAWLETRRKQLPSDLNPLKNAQDNAGRLPGKRRHISPVFYLFGLGLLIASLARPEMMLRLPHPEGTVILAFDVSNSMKAEDLVPNRLEAAKEAARAFIENQPQTINIGVVAFSNGGLVVQPPTNDHVELLATIDRLSTQGGTSLSHGIFSSLNAIAGKAIEVPESALEGGAPTVEIDNSSSAVVLLLTDGEDTGNLDPREIAQMAAEAGVRIYTIGIGSPGGTTIQVDGFNILTRLNESSLKDIARLTNGEYFQAEDGDKLRDIYKNVDLQLTVSGEKGEITSVLAGVSLVFMLAGGALSLAWFGRIP